MIMDIIDLLDISIAQADQTLSSIIKPKPQYLTTTLSTTLTLYGQQSQLMYIKAHLNKDDL